VMSTVWMDGELSRTCRILKNICCCNLNFWILWLECGKYFLNDLFIVSHVSNSNFEFKVIDFPAK
jgi:hypothetical protein